MATTSKGVLLILGGAPNTPHVIEGLGGYFSPTVPRLVGDDFSLEVAKQAVKDHPDLLKLVDVSAGDASDARSAHADFVAEGRNALLEARRDGRAKDDASRTDDEAAALSIDAQKEA